MKRVNGIGGVFFRSKKPQEMKDWYEKHLGIESGEHGGGFRWRELDDTEKIGFTAWNIFHENTEYLDPSEVNYMFNYRVEDLEALLSVLKEEGVEIVGEMQSFSYGKFAWIMDPEGRKIELWEPGEEL